MTDAELDAIEKRAEAATEGPWRVDEDCCITVPEEGGFLLCCVDPHGNTNDGGTSDALFIRYARTDVPALVAALREARAAMALACALLERRTTVEDFVVAARGALARVLGE